MSDEWMKQHERTMHYLSLSARLEGVIEAHRILKEGTVKEDEHDRLLWRLVDQFVKEAEDARL